LEEGLSIRRSVWISSIITLLALAVFIGIAALIPLPGPGPGTVILGVFLAVVPAVIWMSFFYQQDQAEREPKRLVIRVFVFGALVAAAAIPFFQAADQVVGQLPGLLYRLVFTILSISLVQEVLKVAMVRYVVLGSNEFDRYPDGIVYGLASGLGFATVLTIKFVLESRGVVPLAGAIRAVDNVLVHGVLGAVSGYYIGRVKIDGKKLGWMVQGLALVTVLNGLYHVLSDELSGRLIFNPWYSLAVAVALAVIVGAILFYFFRRALLRASGDLTTVSLQAHARSKLIPWDIHGRYDALLVGALLLALMVGWGVGGVLNAQTVPYHGTALPASFRYPVHWAVQAGGSGDLNIRDLSSSNSFKPIISVTSDKLRSQAELDFLVVERQTRDEQQYLLYTRFAEEPDLDVDGFDGVQVDYRYVAQRSDGPVVVRGVVSYVLVEGRLFEFRYEAAPAEFDKNLTAYQRLLESVQFQGEAADNG
jgi:RsiW-degrading membrane proteinase PrsW (M82 family)